MTEPKATEMRVCGCRQPDCFACELASLSAWLLPHGLHIVSEAERKVLDAGNLVLDESLRRIADENGGCLADWAQAELARRRKP